MNLPFSGANGLCRPSTPTVVNLPDTPRETVRDACELPDRELLRRFSAGRDADAFEQLVRRHGPMVLGVCRGMFAMRMRPTMPFRPLFWSSYARRPPSEDRNCWVTGSMAWPFALPPGHNPGCQAARQ